MSSGWKCRVTDSLSRDGWELIVVNKTPSGGIEHVSGITVRHQSWPGQAEAEGQPPIVEREFLQAIMDGLWHGGFRPTGITDVRESTAALKDHLNDMRAIVGSKLGVKLP
jgi:hypothetical protein